MTALPTGALKPANASLWTNVAAPRAASRAINGDLDAEIAIVGGGLAGASTALHLARAGHDVVLIDDALGPIAPATPASAGIVAPQLVRNTPETVVRKLGCDVGGRLLSLAAESGRYTFSLVRDEALDCAPQPNGFLAPFGTSKQAATLATTIASWAPYRDDLELLGADETARLSGCQGYAGALLDKSGGALDPLAYRDQMMERAIAHGLHAIAGRLDRPVVRNGDRYDLHFGGFKVRAQRVVLAGNGGNPGLWPALRRTILPLPVCEVATVPLPAELAASILPGRHALTDLQTDIFTIRFDTHGRLITALPMPDVLDHRAIEQTVNQRLAAMLPAWKYTPLEHVWTGTAWLNSNLLPRLVRCDEGMIAIQACNGRGVAFAAVVGRETARWAENTAYSPALPFGPPSPIRGYLFARHVPRLVMAAASAFRKINGRASDRPSS